MIVMASTATSTETPPQDLLPPALRDRNELGIPRRIDGRVTDADVLTPENPLNITDVTTHVLGTHRTR